MSPDAFADQAQAERQSFSAAITPAIERMLQVTTLPLPAPTSASDTALSTSCLIGVLIGRHVFVSAVSATEYWLA